VEVDNVEEITKGIAAMRFASKGGTRPDAIGDAPKYWGLTEKEYRAKADVWPLDPNGELLAWAIIETKEGVEKVREIAQVKGLSAVIVGAGTLGRRVQHDESRWQPRRTRQRSLGSRDSEDPGRLQGIQEAVRLSRV
jgi:4-hydroxy-2-oxoheptanedioate aldolase